MKKISFLLIFTFCVHASTYVTYNVGLAHSFVRYAPERLPHIIEALKKENADFYCIQEAWRPEDRDQIIRDLKNSHPYSYFIKPLQLRAKETPTCGLLELFGKGGFGRCIGSNCLSKGSDDLTSCVLKECRESMLQLIKTNQECALGLMANVGGSPLSALISVFNPFRSAPLFAYGGGNGLLLLSKKIMSNTQYEDYSDISTLNNRGTLHTVLDGKKIFCSHLTANLGETAYYGGNYLSWENENKLQVKRLLELTKKSSEPILNMGDFNCSMKKGEVRDDLGSNCNQFITHGFKNFYFEKSPKCSFCESNSLVDERADLLLDHIFTKGIKKIEYKRIFKEQVKLDGVEKVQNISDHFGLRITL